MPELPEVQTVVSTLQPALRGQTITAVTLQRSDVLQPAGFDLAEHLTGRKIVDISRRAKRIIFTLSDGNRFYIHLGMTGRLTLSQPREPLQPHTHLLIDFAKAQLRFRDPRRFGGIWWVGKDAADARLGPEPLAIRPRQLAQRLDRTNRSIKNALLDQSLLAGLGNIYVDESLFRAGVHPLARASELSAMQIARLSRAIKFTLRKAIRHRGSTLRDYFDANGNPGGFKALHAVYDRAGEPCRRCKNAIERIIVGGRSTHFCPQCQPGTSHAAATSRARARQSR